MWAQSRNKLCELWVKSIQRFWMQRNKEKLEPAPETSFLQPESARTGLDEG